ncbi:DUF1365 domain-containing protein [Caulobacter segnis]|uniref:DUF1365 domain-containing protein n=2 Tax=Caulobacter segnis TaxID=88688 RepID=D5VMJ6_CAUST|nr:DUF1365 family protein [Caulobacter segnis]ADG11719.1 protein of unknown function DUF1365 [Caulobacter segnis ATCC 21756]AVQ03360.1 DUF1365 domain-containing protein [Caulobacter segnis]
MGASAIYEGVVTHRRFSPASHRLRYRIFMLLLDLDELPALASRLKLLRFGAFGLMSFRAADHGDRSGGDLKAYARERLGEAGIVADGPIRLLCMPRILGYGFNPLSLYFCHRADGELAAILYEVRNTFGQSHSYLAAAPEPSFGPGVAPVRQSAPKRFFVSPFMDMDLTYDFEILPPGEAVGVNVSARRGDEAILTARFGGQHRALTDANLLKAWLKHPLLSFKVILGIHWEAVRIVARGVWLRPRPPLPPEPVTLGASVRS